jgi:hypothetical protein
MTYNRGGLDVALTVPLTHERWPGGMRPNLTSDVP